ncbi:MAG TPA: hypothetical protein VN625_06545 [Desulfuromonadaceae bacterium]|nr:hypothetical protein [Desulfuromonadaceae bacterium]
MKTNLMLATCLLGASALFVGAQDTPGERQNNQNGTPGRGHRPPPPAIIAAVDANHDGVIDADEIANAATVLKALDKNGDGVLTPDEFVGHRPSRPPMDDADRPPMDGQDGPPGQGGRSDGGFGGPPDGRPPGPPSDGL